MTGRLAVECGNAMRAFICSRDDTVIRLDPRSVTHAA
jgi:hypothetical protein